jgi:hypothetical protein
MGNAIATTAPMIPPTTRDWPAPPSDKGPELEHDYACWMCPGFNKRKFTMNGKPGKLINHSHAGFKCRHCERHAHARFSSIDDTCVACRKGLFIHLPVRDRE